MADENEETTAQSTTTVLSKNEITYAELVESQLTKLLYLIHGTGSDRDRTIQLSTLRKWILEGTSDAAFDNLAVSTKIAMNGSPASTEITKGHVKVSSATRSVDLETTGLVVDNTIGQAVKKTEIDEENVKITGGNNVSGMTKLGLNVTDGTKTLAVTRTSVSITEGNDTLTLDKNGLSGSVGGDSVVIGKDRVETAQFRATSYVKTSSSYTLAHQQQSSGNDKEGDIAIVYNNGTSAITVTIAMPSVGSAKTVSINPGCTLPFLCVGEAETSNYSEWSPMANVQIY